MSQHDELGQLATRALRPDFNQYFIFYTSPKRAGLQVANTWSPNREALVREMFAYDFCDELPEILFVVCPGQS